MMSEKRMNALMNVRTAADLLMYDVNKLSEVLLDEYKRKRESDDSILTKEDFEVLGEIGGIVENMLQNEDFVKVIVGLIEDDESDVNKYFEKWEERLYNKEEGD